MIRNMRELDLEQVMKIWLEGNSQAHRFIDRAYWEMKFEPVREAVRKAEVYVLRKKEKWKALSAWTESMFPESLWQRRQDQEESDGTF